MRRRHPAIGMWPPGPAAAGPGAVLSFFVKAFLPVTALLLATLVLPRLCLALPSSADPTGGAPLPPPALSVTGSVHEAAGSPWGPPLADCRVVLREPASTFARGRRLLDPGGDGTVADRQVTDLEGRYRLRAPRPGLWEVSVACPGHVPMLYPLQPLLESRHLPPAVLPVAETVTVTVRNPGGRLTDGARVVVQYEPGSPIWAESILRGWRPEPRVGTTDATGRTELPVLVGEKLRAQAWAPGFGFSRASALDSRGGTLHLRKGRPVEVIPELPEDRGEGSEVLVLLGRSQWPVALVDPGQTFVFVAVPGQENTVRLETAGGHRGAAEVTPPVETAGAQPARVAALRIPLAPPQSLDGRVVDRATGAPIAGAVVWIPGSSSGFSVSAEDGTWRWEAPAGEARALSVAAAGYRTRTVEDVPFDGELSDGEVSDGEVSEGGRSPDRPVLLERASRVHGSVFAITEVYGTAGLAIPDARVRCLGDTVWTSPAGAFTCPDPGPSGELSLEVFAAGHAPWIGSVPIRRSTPGSAMEIFLEPAFAVTGRLLDAEGRPASGWHLTAASEAPAVRALEETLPEMLEIPVAGDGSFRFPHLPPGPYELRASGDHRPVVSVAVFRVPPPAVSREVSLDLGPVHLPPAVPLQGWVLAATREPVERARIVVSGQKLSTPVTTRTDRQGRFQVSGLVPEALVEIEVWHDGVRRLVRSGIQPPTDAPLELVLAAPASLAARVLDPAGEPVAGAHVEYLPGDSGARDLSRTGVQGSGGTVASETVASEAGGWGITGVTDDSGAVFLDHLAPGRGALRVQAVGYLPETTSPLQFEPGEHREGLEVVLYRGGEIRGRVLDFRGHPVEGAALAALPDGGQGVRRGLVGQGRSDAEGSFRISGLATGPHLVTAVHPQHPEAHREVVVPEPDAPPVFFEVILEEGRTAAGVVVDSEGRPLSGAEVVLTSRGEGRLGGRGVADAEGSFRISELAAGRYALHARKVGYAPAVREAPVDLTASSVADLTVVLSVGATLAGKILGLSSEERARLEIGVFRGKEGRRRGRVSADGSYRVDGLSAGAWSLTARLGSGERSLERSVTLAPGQQEAWLDLDFRGGASLSGFVRVDGQPLGQGKVELLSLSGEGERSSALTQPDGRFDFPSIERGPYLLTLVGPDGRLRHRRPVEVDGATSLEVSVDTGSISGRLVGVPPGTVPRVVMRRVEAAGATGAPSLHVAGLDATGRFDFPRLVAGDYVLRVLDDRLQRELTVHVAPGSRTVLDDIPWSGSSQVNPDM